MSDGGEWGPWIEHDGKGCPVPGGTWVQCKGVWASGKREDIEAPANVRWWGWAWSKNGPKITDYRMRKPRALLDLIDLVENLPAPARPLVPA